jgi:hypothetical protein
MTLTPSDFKILKAGNFEGIRIGIFYPFKLAEINDVKLSADLTLATSLAFKIIPQFSAILRYLGSLFSNSLV